MNVLQLSTLDAIGGAERVAMNLHRAFPRAGHACFTVVGDKRTSEPEVIRLDNDGSRSQWSRAWIRAGASASRLLSNEQMAGRVRGVLGYRLGQPWRWVSDLLGHEDFDMPASSRVLGLPPFRPDVLLCHNLHGHYFDLRALAGLSRRLPVFLTLHDMWLLTGHCAYSFGCERWRTGCGRCPDLRIYPSIRRDGTRFNWRRKRSIYARSRLYVTAPSRWLLDKVLSSPLGEGVAEARLIPYGVDQTIFQPGDRRQIRSELDLAPGAPVLAFTSAAGKSHPFKDYATLEAAVRRVSEADCGQDLVLLVVGGAPGHERLGRAQVKFVPYQSNPRMLARYYQAADLFIHAAKEDNYPNVVLESLACGTPVVATAVGGIPEQIVEGVTGRTTPPGDAEAMARAICSLFEDPAGLGQMRRRAAESARERFTLERQVSAYSSWFADVIAHHGSDQGMP